MSLVKQHDVVLLYSGGADSRLLLELALTLERMPYCLLIDYGQKHIRELDFAVKHLKDRRIDYQIVKISNLNLNSGLTGNLIEGQYSNVSPVNVPARNTMLISIAYAIAENKNIDEIWYGADYSDRENLFPDCYQEYVYAMNELLKVAPVKPIRLVAPLLGWTKEMVIDYLELTGVELSDVYSGYEEPRGV
jgi:7-cyano-7-deazaguanine synthase